MYVCLFGCGGRFPFPFPSLPSFSGEVVGGAMPKVRGRKGMGMGKDAEDDDEDVLDALWRMENGE